MTSKLQAEHLASICDDYSTLSTRIAFISSFGTKNLRVFDISILVIEYLQLISQALLLLPDLYEDLLITSNVAYKGVVFVAKLMNPGFWMILEGYEGVTLAILICFTLSTIFKYALFLYLFIVVHNNLGGWKPLLTLWRFIFKAQGRVLCYFSTSFWTQLILMTLRDRYTLRGIQSTELIIWASFIFALEYILSIFLQSRYLNILPTKNFLSSKDNHLELITLFQKLLIQILQMTLSLDSEGTPWIFAILNIGFSLIKERAYFSTLPFYRIEALFYQRWLLTLVFSLNISCFFSNIVEDGDMRFIITTWILLAILTEIASHQYLHRLLLALSSDKKQGSCSMMIQKIAMIQYLDKLTGPMSKDSSKHELRLLHYSSVFARIVQTMENNSELKIENDIYSKQFVNKIFLEYLRSLKVKFPKNEFLRAYIAYFHAKQVKLFGIAIKDINELKKSSSHNIVVSSSLLLYNIQDAVKRQYEDSQSLLNLQTYIKSKALVTKMEGKMMDQLETQKKLYNQVLEESADLLKIFSYSNDADNYKQEIERLMTQVFATIPETYTRPYITCSFYHLSLNHSISDYLTYQKKYNHMYAKYEKHFKAEKLNNDNLYQDDCAFVVFSGQRSEAGNITYCSNSIKALTGKDPQYFIGKSAVFSSPSLRNFYDRFFQNLVEKADSSLLGRIIRGQAYHREEGYLITVDFYANIHPFMTQGYYLDMIIRPVSQTKEYIMILDNGDIECGTKKIAKRLRILRPETHQAVPFVNIGKLSEELKEANDAFNLVDAVKKGKLTREDLKKTKSNNSVLSKVNQSFNGKYSGRESQFGELRKTEISLEKAEEVHELYSTNGKDLILCSLMSIDDSYDNKSNRTYSYHCTIESKFYGSMHCKLITLEEIDDLAIKNEEHVSIHFKESSNRLGIVKGRINKSGDYDARDIEEARDKSADFGYDDEREHRLELDFKTVENPLLNPTAPFETIDEPFSGGATPITSKRQLLQQKTARFEPAAEDSNSVSSEEVQKTVQAGKAFITEGSIASHKSNTAQQKKISNAFRAALAVKYSPSEFRLMSFIFYSILIVVFAIQLVLKGTLDQAVVNLTIGKNIITNAEDKNYLLANDMLMARLVWEIGTQSINTSGLGVFDYPAWLYAIFLKTDAIKLANMNHYILSNASYLDDDQKEMLFANDIRVYETPEDRANNKYTTVNSFQSMDRIVSTLLQVSALGQTLPVIDLKQQLFFLLDNALNDIFVKNIAISDSFMANFETSQTNIDISVMAFMIGASMLFLVAAIVLSVIIVRKYRTEKFNLIAIAQLNNQGVNTALDQMSRFKKILENEGTMYSRQTSMSMVHDRRSVQELKKSDKKERLKTPNHRGIKVKYVFFAGRLWILLVLLIALTVGSSKSERKSISFFQTKQAQLYFTKRLKSHATFTAIVTQELFAGNGSTLIMNVPTSDLIGEAIQYLTSLGSKVATTYMNSDFTYNPNISDILFVDGCPFMNGSSWAPFCLVAKNQGKKTGMIYLIGDLKSSAQNKKLRFESMNRTTTEALADAQVEDFQNIVIYYSAISVMCDAIATIFDNDFENELDSSKSQRNNIFLIFSLIQILLGFLSWFLIFLSLKNYNQQLKKVLQAFPANLILASFTLKTYLMKTSKGALDFVKNEI